MVTNHKSAQANGNLNILISPYDSHYVLKDANTDQIICHVDSLSDGEYIVKSDYLNYPNSQ